MEMSAKMTKFLIQVLLMSLLVATSEATFKKRKGNKGEDASAQGSSHGGSGRPQGGEFPHGGPQGSDPHGYRRDPPHGDSPPHGYRGGDDDYDGHRREPSYDDYRRGPPGQGEDHRGGQGYRRREHDSYRGEPSNHGYRGGEPPHGFQGHRNGPHNPGYRNGGGPFGSHSHSLPTGIRGGPAGDDDDKRRYGPGGPEYDDSDEEEDNGWVGIHGTTSADGSTKANQTEGTGRLGTFFSRTKSGIKRLLKLS